MPIADNGTIERRNTMTNYYKAPFTLDLQLFAGDDESGDGGIVDHDNDVEMQEDDVIDADDSDNDEDAGESEEEDGDADHQEQTQPKNQTKRDNDVYKNMRIKAETEIRTKLEAELAKEREAIRNERQRLAQEQAENKIRSQYITPESIYAKADEEGLTESQAKKMLELEVKNIIDAERSKVKERFNQNQAQKQALQTDRHFKLLESEVEQVVSQRPDLDFQTVFYHMKGMRSEELDKQLTTHVQKKTLADVQDRSRRRVSGSDGGTDENVNPTSVMSRKGLELTNAFGFDPKDIAKYVKTNLKKKG